MKRETVRQTVKEDLGMRRISANMAPRLLTHDKKQRRLHISSDLLYNSQTSEGVIACNETRCFQYDPETERQRMKTQNSSRPKKAHVSVAGQDHACVFLRS